MTASDQDIQDVGRAINLLIRAMGKTPPDDPHLTVDRYVSDDLKHFLEDPSLDIFDVTISRPGIPDFRLLRGGRIRLGGTGVVLQVVNAVAPVKYALKFVRPTFFDKPDYRDSLFTVSKREFLRHAPLSHNNVARILGTTQILEPRDGMTLTFEPFMMEWIDGATPLLEHLLLLTEKPSPTLFSRIADLMSQSFSALAYIHSHKMIHWDLKSDNLLVDFQGNVKLTDFGNARILTDNGRGEFAFTTQGNFPPGLDGGVQLADATGSSNRTRIKLPDIDMWDCPWLDMWMLSRELMDLFGSNSESYQLSSTYQRGPNQARPGAIERLIEGNLDRNEYSWTQERWNAGWKLGERITNLRRLAEKY